MASQTTPPDLVPSLTDSQVEAFLREHLKDFHPEIGRIASVWAMMEFRMDQIIWELMGVEQTLGACLTTQLHGSAPRLRVLKSLMELRGSSPALITKLNKFSADILKPQEDRNRAVHDPWFVGVKSKEVSQIRKATIDNKIVYERFPVASEDLKSIYRASVAMLKRFLALRNEILMEPLSALRERSRKRLYRAGLEGGMLSSPGKNP